MFGTKLQTKKGKRGGIGILGELEYETPPGERASEGGGDKRKRRPVLASPLKD